VPLSRAAENGNKKVVQMLLGKEGVGVDSKNRNGRGPLSLAAENGYEKVVQMLLGRGRGRE
jgi:ankyrin repeat protein